jgi:hypothetical protein
MSDFSAMAGLMAGLMKTNMHAPSLVLSDACDPQSLSAVPNLYTIAKQHCAGAQCALAQCIGSLTNCRSTAIGLIFDTAPSSLEKQH